jgi:hypothetical protein
VPSKFLPTVHCGAFELIFAHRAVIEDRIAGNVVQGVGARNMTPPFPMTATSSPSKSRLSDASGLIIG